jgi:formate hydrogenlyase transcriptional activator
MSSAVSHSPDSKWLLKNGPRELELLFRTIVYYPSAPIIVADDEGKLRDASVGLGKLLGLSRKEIIGRTVDDFAPLVAKGRISQLWNGSREQVKQEGTLGLLGPDESLREVDYTIHKNVLPVRHVLALRAKSATAVPEGAAPEPIPPSIRDYALYLLNIDERVVAWYAGAERIYGYPADEALGHHVAWFYPGPSAGDESLTDRLRDEFKRASAEGHLGTEGWHSRKDGSRFWANAITVVLKDELGDKQGYARVVRDFSERHETDEKLRLTRVRSRATPLRSTIAGIVSGEFDVIPEVNDIFLTLVGYTREDLDAGRLIWPNLTPPEFAALDELAHEECLQFGACTPFEKQMIRKDGTRIPVLVATAVLKLCPFRWITFVQDLRERDRIESVEEEHVELNQDFEEMVGSSPALKRILQQAEVVAPTDATVLILGETGTGKELVARAVHRMSPRRNFPFISLNCAAIPTGLLESELFGYERGAFTGALQQKIGRFEMAHRGTLFLDEVGDIPLDLQPKLLRALQEKAFERLGGTKTIPIDVRLLAATNRNLTQMMGDKLFRSDLYYRLKVFPITTPPLRDRPEDIPMLARHFTKKYAAKMNREIESIPAATMQALVKWHWPGNIRELENFIERAVILSRGPSLRAPIDELQEQALEHGGGGTLEEVEREHIIRALRASDGVVTAAAVRLGLHRTTLNAMLRKLGISRKDF